jgi:hypothetical protein
MKRLAFVVLGVVALIGAGLSQPSFPSFAQRGSPVASPIGSPEASPIASPASIPTVQPTADLEGMILDLQATVSAQSDEIDALQTQVADLAVVPVATATEEISEADDLLELTVVITLRARPDEVDGSDVGDSCVGLGRWADLGDDTSVTLVTSDGAFEAGVSPAEFTVTSVGMLFRECQSTVTFDSVPGSDAYTISVGNQPAVTVTSDEVTAANNQISIVFGP